MDQDMLTAKEYQKLVALRKKRANNKGKNKYGAKKTEVDGHVFDSKAEALRYSVLKIRQDLGQIKDLELQPAYTLHALGGSKVGTYKADFRYTLVATGEPIVEDVKGGKATQTEMFRWKKRHMKAEYGIEVQVVTK